MCAIHSRNGTYKDTCLQDQVLQLGEVGTGLDLIVEQMLLILRLASQSVADTQERNLSVQLAADLVHRPVGI